MKEGGTYAAHVESTGSAVADSEAVTKEDGGAPHTANANSINAPPFSVIEFPGPVDRFHESIEVDEYGCWLWKGPRFSKNGYGRFYIDGKEIAAHRFAYQLYVRPIGPTRVLDHECARQFTEHFMRLSRRRCCNPEHLRPVSGTVNNALSDSASAQNARKKNCPKCRRKYTRRPDGRRVCINATCPGKVKRK